ncbi:hypothetical protein JNW90_03995 [Micromonospora sp. STR1s_5]|nr:hypothetical protein [Micromonospora sp. STR1s_5]
MNAAFGTSYLVVGGGKRQLPAARDHLPGPDVATAVIRSADLLREGRVLLLGLADSAEVRDAAAAGTGRVNTVTARTDRVDVDA